MPRVPSFAAAISVAMAFDRPAGRTPDLQDDCRWLQKSLASVCQPRQLPASSVNRCLQILQRSLRRTSEKAALRLRKAFCPLLSLMSGCTPHLRVQTTNSSSSPKDIGQNYVHVQEAAEDCKNR